MPTANACIDAICAGLPAQNTFMISAKHFAEVSGLLAGGGAQPIGVVLKSRRRDRGSAVEGRCDSVDIVQIRAVPLRSTGQGDGRLFSAVGWPMNQ